MFIVTIKNIYTEKEIEKFIFDTEKEAKSQIRKSIKEFNLIRHAGHIVNYSDRLELWTNF